MSRPAGEANALPLDGLVIGVPAARRAAETAKLIERWGGTPLVGPTVEEVPVADDRGVLETTRAVIDLRPGWSVHITGVGTRRWFERAEKGGLLESLLDTLRSARLIPRGQKASAALNAFGLSGEWSPPGETSAEIAEWLAPQLATGDSVVVQRHGEPVEGLSAAIRGAGAQTIEVVTYRWEIPSDRGPAEALIRAIVSGGVHALVITSAPQVRHLFAIADDLDQRTELARALDQQVYLAAVGEVATSGLQAEGLAADLIAHPPRLGALVRMLAASRTAVEQKAATTA